MPTPPTCLRALLRVHHRPSQLPGAAALTLALAAGAAGASDEAAAQESASAGLPLWELGLFAGALTTPAYPASAEQNQRALVLPFLVYRGDVIRADRNGLGARMVHTDRVEIDVGFAGSLPASSNDIALRRGMPDLGTLVEFGPRAKWRITEPAPGQRLALEVPLRAVLEWRGGVNAVGYALEPNLSWEQTAPGNWRVRSALSAVIGDQALNDYFYAVPEAYATATRPRYSAQAGLISTRISLDGSKQLSPDVRVFAFARYDSYQGSANPTSPLFAQTQGRSLGLGLSWTLGRSDARAGD